MWRFRLLKSLLTAVSLTVSPAANAESWLCIGDLATGFAFNKETRRWEITKFNTNDSRYIISSSQSKESPYLVRNFGSDSSFPLAFCKDGFSADTFLRCRGLVTDFSFNVKTMRYSYSYNVGYINPTPGVNDMKEGDDTPLIEIGRCSRLQ
jgi:hypothetical protein